MTVRARDELLHHGVSLPENDVDDLLHVRVRSRTLQQEDISSPRSPEGLDHDGRGLALEKLFNCDGIPRDQRPRSQVGGQIHQRELRDGSGKASWPVDDTNPLFFQALQEAKRGNVLGMAGFVSSGIRSNDA
jgi:hypothetical protein